VQTTMREANDRGFDCLLVSDATASYTPAFKKATLEMVVSQVRSPAVSMLHPSCRTVLCFSAWRVSAALQLRTADLRPQAASKPSCHAHAPAMLKQGAVEIRLATCQCRAASWAGRLMPLLLLMRWHSDGRDLHWEHEDHPSARVCRPRICIEVLMHASVLSASIFLHTLFSLTSAPASQHDGATNAPVALEMLAHQLDLLQYHCSFRLFRQGVIEIGYSPSYVLPS
jgi:Isochorismatase family